MFGEQLARTMLGAAGFTGIEVHPAPGDPGDAIYVSVVQPIFDTLKPEGDSGFVHAGGVGAGHFAKMVHNGIEYAIMQAYAEGWELLQKVAEEKSVKNRMHLDIEVPDIEAEASRLVTLGAHRVRDAPRHEHGTTWLLMADPEGNEFCVCDGGQTG